MDSRVLQTVLTHVNLLDSSFNEINVLNSNLGVTGMYSLNRFLALSTEDTSNFFGLYSVNAPVTAVSHLKSLIQLVLLKKLESVPQKKRIFVNQSFKNTNAELFDQTKTSLLNDYIHLPVNMIYEDNETYLNTQGSIKRVSKLLHFKKNAKTNWQLIRKLYSSLKSLSFYNNQKDNYLAQFDCANSFNFKNYTGFQYSAVQTLTSLSYYLMTKNSPISLGKSFFKSSKTKMFNTKIKFWCDDFFNLNSKDFFSYNSSTLVNCSKISRFSSTNFF